MNDAVADDFGFLSEFGSFVFVLESIGVVGLITGDAKVCIFRLAILPGDVIFTEFAGDFLCIG